ncbi:MAG TPA: hypothetical protein VER04_03365 [Polyangiaceae bacterium]|nr:hypothetical protein [Polyangiaceae bacterium]
MKQLGFVFWGVLSASFVTACASAGTDDGAELSSSESTLKADATSKPSAGAPSDVSVNVDVASSLGKLSRIAVGANGAAWDADILDPEVPSLLSRAGVQVMRYPGGSLADNYHWLSGLPDDPNVGGADPDVNFDAYMSIVKTSGAQAMLTVNYGSGTAEEAADWVRYANRGGRRYSGPTPTYAGASANGHNYGIRYWEVGNELYGDGTYGASWEVNHKSHDPTTYANGVVSYAEAMKAVDPSIRVGAVLTAPGNWPDGQVNAGSPEPWNDTVLPIACSSLDFVSIHWYAQGPSGESDAALLSSPQNGEATSVSYTPSIPSMIASLKALLSQHCGAHAEAIQIMVTETNSVSYNPGKQTTSLVNALFLADQVMTWLENGVTNVDWWAVHNSPFDGNNDASLYGSYTFGDYGILSRGLTSDSGATEPPAQTPFPAYYGLQMLSYLGHDAGSELVSASTSNPLVAAHAVKQPNGKTHVLLINKDPSTTRAVTVSMNRGCSQGAAKVLSYGMGDSAIRTSRAQVRGSSFSVRLPPYSMSTIQLQ